MKSGTCQLGTQDIVLNQRIKNFIYNALTL